MTNHNIHIILAQNIASFVAAWRRGEFKGEFGQDRYKLAVARLDRIAETLAESDYEDGLYASAVDQAESITRHNDRTLSGVETKAERTIRLAHQRHAARRAAG